MNHNIVSTPTHERCVTSYAARTQYKPGTVHPPLYQSQRRHRHPLPRPRGAARSVMIWRAARRLRK